MIKGIGVDIVEMKRFMKLIESGGERFLHRGFTRNEIDYCRGKSKSGVHFSGIFAAKEAAYKALGMQWVESFNWKQIQITHESVAVSRPGIIFSGSAKESFNKLGANEAHLSISHDTEYAVAMVVLSD